MDRLAVRLAYLLLELELQMHGTVYSFHAGIAFLNLGVHSCIAITFPLCHLPRFITQLLIMIIKIKQRASLLQVQ